MPKKTEIKCPWCSQVTAVTGFQVNKKKNDFGTVIERRCPNCGNVVAAYCEEAGEFMTEMRNF